MLDGGISQEAISFAGHKKLNKLIVLFDDNKISIDGSTDITCSDDQEKRFRARNWNTMKIDGHNFREINNALNKQQDLPNQLLFAAKQLLVMVPQINLVKKVLMELHLEVSKQNLQKKT